jgi:hypothetical protein
MALWYRMSVWRLAPHPTYHQCSGNGCHYADNSYRCYQDDPGTADGHAGLFLWLPPVPSQALNINQTLLPPTPMFALPPVRPGADNVLTNQAGGMYWPPSGTLRWPRDR